MSQPLATRALRWFRAAHTWTGLVLGLAILAEAVTGFWLTHQKRFEAVGRLSLRAPSLGAPRITRHVAEGMTVIAATEFSLLRSQDGGKTFALLPITLPLEITALALRGESLLVGTEAGLWRCRLDTATCREGGLGLPTPAVVKDILLDAQSAWVGLHHQGVFRAEGERWVPEGADLAAAAELHDGEVELHVHALARWNERLLVGTSRGVFELRPEGATVFGLEGRAIETLRQHQGALYAGVKGKGAQWRFDGVWAEAALEAPAPLAGATLPEVPTGGLTLGKLMKDLHTGKLFGERAWFVYDLIALALVMFVGTGFYLHLWPALLRRRRAAIR